MLCACAQPPVHVYIGDLGPRHALIAWGTVEGSGNTIGRGATPPGKATVTVGPHRFETSQSWIQADGLQPDKEYDYSVSLPGRPVEKGRFRTWPESASQAAFLVIGDWGNGSKQQRRIAEAMTRLVAERAGGPRPIRFVLSTGDNIYSVIPGVFMAGSGSRDSHWGPRFFEPYAAILRSLPFYPVLGNHDGNESERRDDLTVYLDNFFFPGNRPARWYQFHYADLIDFVALDTTENTAQGGPKPAWAPDGEQHRWARESFARLQRPWRIAYMHHPVFNAGPRHNDKDNEKRLAHFVDLFARARVQAVFQGHEHNFQVSEANARSRGIRYFISGAGGELRDGDVRSSMAASNIAGWAPQHHFLLVEVSAERMEVTPMSDSLPAPKRPDGGAFPLPVVVERAAGNKVD